MTGLLRSQVGDIGEILGTLDELNTILLSKIDVPDTEIVNRAQIADLTQDLKPRFGIDRIQTQEAFDIQNEVGPNGELVSGVVNDKLGQIRFYGSGIANVNNTGGVYVRFTDTDDVVEITFYGTGLNALLAFNDGSRDIRATTDGGAEGANLWIIGSTVLNARNYSNNHVLPIVSGLPLEIHTIKIRNATANQIGFNGFEILNEEATGLIQLPIGSQLHKGKKLTHDSAETTLFNSDFESGTLGTRGGHVCIYQKADGSIAKSVNPTESSQLNLSAADHSNEEIIGHHIPREFGAGRSDDFSTLENVASDRAFTLDDGTTTLMGEDVRIGSTDGVFATGVLDKFLTFTFIGTGLDVEMDNTSGVGVDYDISVDGAATGTISKIAFALRAAQKVVSGLPYGTHTVKFNNPNPGLNGPNIFNFKIYGPKKPDIPEGAKTIADYFIMADFVAGTVGDENTIATGVLRKHATREFTYTGAGHAVASFFGSLQSIGGFQISSATSGDTIQYTFLGTGIEIRGRANVGHSGLTTLDIDGESDFVTGIFGAVTTSAYGGYGFTASTGNIDGNNSDTNGSGVSISGLPLGLHTVTLTKGSNFAFPVEAFDIITPIHSPKLNGPVVIQNTLRIGSQGICDLRRLNADQTMEQPAMSKVRIVAGAVNNTSSTVWKTIPNMSTSFNVEKAGLYELAGSAPLSDGVGVGNPQFTIFLNGKQVGNISWADASISGQPLTTVSTAEVYLHPGQYLLDGRLKVNSVGRADVQASLGEAATLSAKMVRE